ncbi:MAG: helix-turn-helix transcriptional regulator [Planctomycetes bacterium]|nr:helix-turn-helix transcriptional regulator [Planctomycetota bacterium]
MSGIPTAPAGRPLPLHHPSALPLRRLGVTGGGLATRTVSRTWEPSPARITALWVIEAGWRLDGEDLAHPWLWVMPPTADRRQISIPDGRSLLWFEIAPLPRWAELCRAGLHQRHPGGKDRHDTTHVLVSRWMAEAAAPWLLAERVAHSIGDAIAAILERRLHVLSAPGAQPHGERLGALWRRVQEDPIGPWPLARLARLAGCSPSHLHRLCLMGSGLPPVGMVADIRLRRAADLLLDGTRTIEQAAELVGYSSGAALSKAYFRRFGARPGRWRR